MKKILTILTLTLSTQLFAEDGIICDQMSLVLDDPSNFTVNFQDFRPHSGVLKNIKVRLRRESNLRTINDGDPLPDMADDVYVTLDKGTSAYEVIVFKNLTQFSDGDDLKVEIFHEYPTKRVKVKELACYYAQS